MGWVLFLSLFSSDFNSVNDARSEIDEDDIADKTQSNLPSSDESSDSEGEVELLQDSSPEQDTDEDNSDSDESTANEALQDHSLLFSDFLKSKDGSIWYKNPIPQTGRTPSKNVYKPPKSHLKHAQKITSPSSAFSLIFTDKIIQTIIKMTDLEGQRIHGDGWKKTNMTEKTVK